MCGYQDGRTSGLLPAATQGATSGAPASTTRFDPTDPAAKWDAMARMTPPAYLACDSDSGTRLSPDLLEVAEARPCRRSIREHLSRRMLEHYSHIRIKAKAAPIGWTIPRGPAPIKILVGRQEL